ncbi:polysaccharide lyase family 7 protein [Pseudomonas protegens]|uniref:polysaccharide lyase family 7 protein n=1 Tax=Pseudomonas protegens TaxID=380021 RepID=UPI00200D6035|nr:polysaccharide lyase family 7 protein [Pseudomonas protegens]
MPVDISTLDIATPLPTSASNPLALELNGNLALAQCPSVISRLADGSIQLRAPTRGAASKSTHRTRCEWKESRYWALSSAADHWSRQQMILTKVNSAQKVVVAQMHVRDDVNPAVKVFWDKGILTYALRQSFNGADPRPLPLLGGVPLDAMFQLSIHCTYAGLITIGASCNGQQASSPPHALDSTWNDQVFDFHGGIYNQIDFTPSTPAEDGSVCIISQLSISHV